MLKLNFQLRPICAIRRVAEIIYAAKGGIAEPGRTSHLGIESRVIRERQQIARDDTNANRVDGVAKHVLELPAV